MTTVALAFAHVDPLIELLEDELDDSHLTHFLDLGGEPLPRAVWESALLGPAREILARPGKEFRKNLVEIAWQLSGGASKTPIVLSLLVEILHAGSLVIDDIEDGSPYRRGKPALHAMCGVPVALNTGNWLYFWPFALLSRLGFPAPEELELSREIVRTLMACHCGQGLDLSVRWPVSRKQRFPGWFARPPSSRPEA